MTQFLLHLALALLWMLLWGAFDVYTFLVGVIVGFVLLWHVGRPSRASVAYPIRQISKLGHPVRLWRLTRFTAFFVRILVVANWQVAKLILSPRMPIQPRFIRYDVSDLTPVQITTLAIAITLTPGTLAADLSTDDSVLYIHCINAPDVDAAVREIDELKDRLLRGVFA